jgi:hypothetical protein
MTNNDTLPHEPFNSTYQIYTIYLNQMDFWVLWFLFNLSDLSPKPGNMPTLLQTFTLWNGIPIYSDFNTMMITSFNWVCNQLHSSFLQTYHLVLSKLSLPCEHWVNQHLHWCYGGNQCWLAIEKTFFYW